MNLFYMKAGSNTDSAYVARISRHARPINRSVRMAVLAALLLTFMAGTAGNAVAQLHSRIKSVIDTTLKEEAPSEAQKPPPVPKVLGPPDDFDRGVPRTKKTRDTPPIVLLPRPSPRGHSPSIILFKKA